MISPKIISPEIVLWSQLLLMWSIAAYGIAADPLRGEAANIRWVRWTLLLSVRTIFAAVLMYALVRSVLLVSWLLLSLVCHPLLRYRLPMRLLAEFEACWMSAFMIGSMVMIHHFHFVPQCLPDWLTFAQLAAMCVLASTLTIVVRGGTYIVRGILRKAGALPGRRDSYAIEEGIAGSSSPGLENDDSQGAISIAASVDDPQPHSVNVKEYNRGRLIGNLERIVLTIVVAAGSYAALAFLVAAKGVVRFDEFEKNRDFAEYFLIGSLSSVLVALCAGIALRFALIRLLPDLLSLQIQ
jgi:hypothetical protein